MRDIDCQICGKKSPEPIVFLPIKQKDGNLSTIACNECAGKSEAFCQKHRRAHRGFRDGSTACPSCVEEMAETNKNLQLK